MKVHCPTCRKEVLWDPQHQWRPFCSQRCRLIDLGAWANEDHRLPGDELHSAAEDINEPATDH